MATEITREEYGIFNGTPEPEVPAKPDSPEVLPAKASAKKTSSPKKK